jgi:hypothetical protein
MLSHDECDMLASLLCLLLMDSVHVKWGWKLYCVSPIVACAQCAQVLRMRSFFRHRSIQYLNGTSSDQSSNDSINEHALKLGSLILSDLDLTILTGHVLWCSEQDREHPSQTISIVSILGGLLRRAWEVWTRLYSIRALCYLSIQKSSDKEYRKSLKFMLSTI